MGILKCVKRQEQAPAGTRPPAAASARCTAAGATPLCYDPPHGYRLGEACRFPQLCKTYNRAARHHQRRQPLGFMQCRVTFVAQL
jgi:hypothetical protein